MTVVNRVFVLLFLSCSLVSQALDIPIPQIQIEKGAWEGKTLVIMPENINIRAKIGRVNLVSFKDKVKLGIADIYSNSIVTREIADKELGFGPGSTRAYLWLFFGTKGISKRVRLIKLKNMSFKSKSRSIPIGKSVAGDFSFITRVDKTEVKKMLGEGVPLLDVRLPSLAKRFKIPGSKSLSIITNLSFNKYSGYSIRLSQLRRMMADDYFAEEDTMFKYIDFSVKKKIIVYCENEIDPSCIRSLIKLHSLGAKNLHWYTGGVYDWNAYQLMVPTKISGIKIINEKEVQSLRKGKHILLDVRSGRDFKLGHARGAKNVYYKNFKSSVYAFGREPKNKSDLQKEKLKFKIRKLKKVAPSKDIPIIIMGQSSADWAAYKAAIFLRDINYSKVYFYRDGYYAWRGMKLPDEGLRVGRNK